MRPLYVQSRNTARLAFFSYEWATAREMDEVIEWCREHFGRPARRWTYSWTCIVFEREDDAFAFKMRWC